MKNIFLKLQNVSKSFSGKNIFQNLSFEFNLGSYAILGANGIGKSTLLTIMTGSIPCDAGDIIINGVELLKHPVAAKKHISYIPDKTMIYPFIKGNEFLNFISTVKKSPYSADTKALISAFNLNCYMDMTFSEMSLGTQKKFMIIAAMISDPSILIMDEPTNALEQSSRDVFINYLLQQAKNKILIIATHDQQLIDNIHAKEIVLSKHPIRELRL